MRMYRICVRRPQAGKEDPWETQRTAYVVVESFDQAVEKVTAYYNDLEDVDDYYASDVCIEASTELGEGALLLI